MNTTITGKTHEFLAAVKHRRSIYAIGNAIEVSEQRIEEVVGEAVLHTPSAFNSQSARVVILFKDKHVRLWNLTEVILRGIVPADQFSSTEQRMQSFRSGYGTILFYEDQTVIEGLQQKFATYKDNFPIWSQQSNGMLQYVIWTALELEGLGASLQHYNPLIDDKVRSEWGLPQEWKLIAQMPFGHPEQAPGEKQFEPLEKRLRVIR